MSAVDIEYDDDEPTPYTPPLTLSHAAAVLQQDGADSSGYVQAIAQLSIARSLDRLVELLEQRHVADRSRPHGPGPGERRMTRLVTQYTGVNRHGNRHPGTSLLPPDALRAVLEAHGWTGVVTRVVVRDAEKQEPA